MDELQNKHVTAKQLESVSKLLDNFSIENVVSADELIADLSSGKKLNVYFGIDPTSPDVHLGHTLPLRLLQSFANLGHKTTLLIGDFTATIGDPSGRDIMRQPLSESQVRENANWYKKQVENILDLRKTEIRYNSEWYKKMNLKDFFKTSYLVTAQQLWERDMFQKRQAKSQPISVSEFLYPVLQGYDAVALKADVQLGGSDQLFNMLVSRDLVKKILLKDQLVLTTPLIEGTDGRKMSKSYGNVIGINLPPSDMYGKLMTINDDLIERYGRLLANWGEIMGSVMQYIKTDPKQAKSIVAKSIVSIYRNSAQAQLAEKEFDEQFRLKKIPTNIPDYTLTGSDNLGSILLRCNLVESNNAAKRLIEQGGVRLDSQVQTDINIMVHPKGQILQVGKRKFIKLRRSFGD